jgi:hypothetical protein
MQALFDKLVDEAAGIAAAAIMGTLWLNIKWLFQSKRNMEQILSEVVSTRSHLAVLYTLQGPILMSMKASLEALRDGTCNGNVDEALRLIAEEKKKFDEHLLAAIAGTEQKEHMK